MPYLVAGLLLLWLASVAMKGFVRANPALLARRMRQVGAVATVGVALMMLLRGRIDIALGLLGLGLWLGKVRTNPFRPQGFAGFGARRSRRVSRVRSAMIEMELDHASGRLSGTVLAGPDEGAPLDELNRTRCFRLFERCLTDDPEGARLLESYFDRRFAGWREASDRGSNAGRAEPGGRTQRAGFMSEDEAHEVLGLSKRATREEITRAHRALMKKFHPDHGGSTDLAARVNEAKDVLMRRHH